MPDPQLIRTHFAYPAKPCALPLCLRTHWWQARCGCGWRATSVRKTKAQAAKKRHEEEGNCGG